MTDWSFYKNKRILVTGHTGFKGSWMCRLLLEMGADVTGYALKPPAGPAMYTLCGLENEVESVEGDIRDLEKLDKVFAQIGPELVIHMAAQPIVREGYKSPVYTYDVNVMGTVNILECIRRQESVKSFLNVTTDKVYHNREWEWGYRENEELNGFDPYSNSKSCSELVTSCYRNSYFGDAGGRVLPISTARAGNVIGGGDFAADRIIPDCVRAAQKGEAIEVRNPYSVRPYQHVLEPVAVYLMILQKQCENVSLAGNYNVGPKESDCLCTGALADAFCNSWEKYCGKPVRWNSAVKEGPHEANFLKLDCARLKSTFGWQPCFHALWAVEKSVEWYARYSSGENMENCTQEQIREFLACWKERGN